MLFNKKLMMGLINVTGVLLILTFLLNIAMYIWAFFGKAPLQLFDVTGGIVSYYVLLNKLATLVFFYIMLGAFASLVKGSKLPEGFKK
ncbi:MAG: hypothetical protein U0519_04165 [Candidatus Gracilibacteria bacterium]